MEITVRRAEPSDTLPAALSQKLSDEQLTSKRRDGAIMLALVRGHPVGWVVTTTLWGRVPFLELLQVEGNHRRIGVATALLRGLEDQLRDEGRAMLFSSAQDDNPPALSWHLELGFEESGVIHGMNPDDIGEVFFRKGL